MRIILCAIVLYAAAIAGCGRQPVASGEPQALTAGRAAQVEHDVRTFMQTVAHDVTQDSPTAWLKHFTDVPAFFMAVDGHMAFPNYAAASNGTQAFARGTKHIELVWGNDEQKDVRVDPLTPNLAVVATPWHEVIVNAAGESVTTTGYFTGVPEFRDGRWQLRDAHWSSPLIPIF